LKKKQTNNFITHFQVAVYYANHVLLDKTKKFKLLKYWHMLNNHTDN